MIIQATTFTKNSVSVCLFHLPPVSSLVSLFISVLVSVCLRSSLCPSVCPSACSSALFVFVFVSVFVPVFVCVFVCVFTWQHVTFTLFCSSPYSTLPRTSFLQFWYLVRPPTKILKVDVGVFHHTRWEHHPLTSVKHLKGLIKHALINLPLQSTFVCLYVHLRRDIFPVGFCFL